MGQIPFFHVKTVYMEKIAFKPSLAYKVLYKWVRYVFGRLYYRRTYCLHQELIPPQGTPVILISNHQNSLLDAFQMLFGTGNNFLHFISRADVFRKKPIARLLYGLGLIPIYRVRDGVGKIKDNLQMFSQVEEYINDGGMLAIYPEATHMDGNWIGRFYLSYVRIGFETAERSHFEKEVFILPSTLYYEDFSALRSQCLIDFSEPFSLRPFYEMYQANPRQAEAEVNEIIRHRVQEKMLDVKDTEHYQQVMDFIRYSEEAVAAERQEVDMKELPQALGIRKEIEASLSDLKEKEGERLEQIYSHTAEYSRMLRKYRISDQAFRHPATTRQTANSALLYLLLLPFHLIGLLPHLPIYAITPLATRKLEDKLMYASIDICIWVLGIPIFYLIYFFLLGAFGSWLFALIFILLLPVFGRFAHWYHHNFQEDFQRFRANLIRKNRKKSWEKMRRLREELDKELESLRNNG